MVDVLLPITIIGVIIFIGFVGDLIFKKTDVPSIIWLLLFGLLLGPILKIVDASVFLNISELFAAIAVIIILFEGGLNLDIYKLFREAPRGLMLTLLAFTFSALIVTVIMVALGFNVLTGLLLGVIVGGTSSPIVIPIINKIPGVSNHVRTVLSIESALTDALSILMAIVVMETIISGIGLQAVGQILASGFSIGIVIGSLSGLFWIPISRRFREEEFSYLVTLGIIFLLYSFVESLGGSGAIACLSFGVVLGNGKKIFGMLKYQNMEFELDKPARRYHALIAFIIRTFFFVYLGILVSFIDFRSIIFGILLAIALFSIRPLAIRAAMHKMKISDKERHLMMAMFPRGLAAAVLAYIPFTRGIHNTYFFADVTFGIILTTVLISTLALFYIGRIHYDDDGNVQAGRLGKKSAHVKPKAAKK
ncbi:MAG: cation:proton antiporter [DPANN group archaeon]|nr:cation:proton antiporter [DPANN group archaeon]